MAWHIKNNVLRIVGIVKAKAAKIRTLKTIKDQGKIQKLTRASSITS